MNQQKLLLAVAIGLLFALSGKAQHGAIIFTNNNQAKLLSTYRFVLEQSDAGYRGTGVTDSVLFSNYSEFSLYRACEGTQAGSIIYPDALPDEYANLSSASYSNYNWVSQRHVAIQFTKNPGRIAIYKSKYKTGGKTLNWEAIYFERLFSEFLMDGISYTVSEDSILQNGVKSNTQLLIIPAFTVKDSSYTYYIDSILSHSIGLKEKFDAFLSRGGTIYTEGNAAYFLEKLGYLENGAVNYNANHLAEGNIEIQLDQSTHILALGASAAQNIIYGTQFPLVNSNRLVPIASQSVTNNPVLFQLNAAYTSGGNIFCNTGLPLVKGLSSPDAQGQQVSWTLNSILAAFSTEVDVTRKVTNELLYQGTLGNNHIAYDRADTFEVTLTLRNLSNTTKSVEIIEKVSPYFTYLDVVSGPLHTYSNHTLSFSGINMNAHSQQTITYRLITPEPESNVHENVDKYLSNGTLIAASVNSTSYTTDGYNIRMSRKKNYADLLFSARIFADTDVNYKNFLGLAYQPFKVFMIMENKSRSTAENTEYVQYIPKDVPFYWSDQSINIPILKTPGGKYIDILRGSNDQDHPEYDMDSDGDPDVWLDTASIYPKGYTIVEESVYWANPWNHLRTGDKSFVFEDIDRDGVIPEDTDGDGVPDANLDEDDKIRVWKVTWDIGQVAGYDYYDPYCSYEIWVDPPDLVPMSAGIAHAYDSLSVDSYPGMFYPYNAGVSDTTWKSWMEHDENGEVIWKQFIHQRINNYEGFTWVDTSEYQMLPTDSLIGTAPQPHREFIAVLSLGGEEIDMRNYAPSQSLYSKVNYETVFGEQKVTPIRTTYTYYAPLPNPLQFEYLSNNYTAIGTNGETLTELPEYGQAQLVFDMDASTEYTYYWIRNAGYDVDYNDASENIDGIEALGDGVFGYFVYSIPKGMGGYKISLAKNEDGTYNTDSIVQIDGLPFTKWIDNPNTWSEVEIWESAFEYQDYIPQFLIPAALDDDNNDGIDDWIDDRGDRFCSKTGYLHDAFMPGNGEDYSEYPKTPFTDDIYGQVDSGWYAGADDTYGDDYFETLGKTHITINASYEGRGREGSVEISKGGVLVCEEIFGGSPWVIFSHVLSGYAQGTDISVTSKVSPEVIYYGVDTVYIKHTIADTCEPHKFNVNFDPYHISYGYSESTVTTYVGAKDPCSLIAPVIAMPAIIDPSYDNHSITLVPNAADNPGNTDLAGYPKQVSGTFIEVRVEVGNSTDDNWINTTVKPQLSPELGTVELSYVAYPRPLVPSHVVGGELIPGDQPNTFTTGWRFNQPEGEVLIKMGDTLNLLQPTRKAYFVFLIRINSSLEKGIYEIPFTMWGTRKHYTGTENGTVQYAVPTAKFCIADKNAQGTVLDFEDIIMGQGSLASLTVDISGKFSPLGEVKFANHDFGATEFNSIPGKLPISGNTIDLGRFSEFPKYDTTVLTIVQKGIVDSYNTDAEILPVTNGQALAYTDGNGLGLTAVSGNLSVKPLGPRIKVTNTVHSLNGLPAESVTSFEPEADVYVVTLLKVKNTGTDISSNTIITINPGPYYTVVTDSLPNNCTMANGKLLVDAGDLSPGEQKSIYLPFLLTVQNIPSGVDIRQVIDFTQISYEGTLVDANFSFNDPDDLLVNVYDFEATELSFTNLGASMVQVTAKAFNRGIDGKNVWFRIYPIIGGGAYEFPFAEIQAESFEPGESIDLSGTYTIPITSRTVEFIAIVDDGFSYDEVTEQNNSIRIAYTGTHADNTPDIAQSLNIFPQPFTDIVHFEYYLQASYDDITLYVYGAEGKKVCQMPDCPGESGQNDMVWRRSDLMPGVYIYQMIGTTATGRKELLFTGKITKTR